MQTPVSLPLLLCSGIAAESKYFLLPLHSMCRSQIERSHFDLSAVFLNFLCLLIGSGELILELKHFVDSLNQSPFQAGTFTKALKY